MHPATPETPREVLSQYIASDFTSLSQYGSDQDDPAALSPSLSEEHGAARGPGSEGSTSTSPTPSEYDTRLDTRDMLLLERGFSVDRLENIAAAQQLFTQTYSSPTGRPLGNNVESSRLLRCPHEVIFHILSYLQAVDLLNVKLVSRSLTDLVNSPHAWISAFSKYFPGPAILKSITQVTDSETEQGNLKTEKRSFTRLSPVASWTNEYLLRTKLLRCLARGRPSVPFAAPLPGKPHKGFATFSFYSRLRLVTHLDARFGAVGDKRLPQFVHGSSLDGHVSISDKRGESSGWPPMQHAPGFRSFHESNPGDAAWGLGGGHIVGLPNVMDLSSVHGMIYGEGTPGGYAFFLATNEKRGRFLAPLLGISDESIGLPKISHDLSSICSVWIAKSLSIPRASKGLIGLITGSSSGVVTAYSLGLAGGREQRLDRGELTARWLLSPGVPIVALAADEKRSEERSKQHRLCIVALNALGEVFYLTSLPKQLAKIESHLEETEVYPEKRAWKTGASVQWRLVEPSRRLQRSTGEEEHDAFSYYPYAVRQTSGERTDRDPSNMRNIQAWLTKKPVEVKSDFAGWDMRRRMEVDFAGDDGQGAGESILVVDCGLDEEISTYGGASITRYTRRCLSHVTHNQDRTSIDDDPGNPSPGKKAPSWSFQPSDRTELYSQTAQVNPADSEIAVTEQFEWRSSDFSFGSAKNFKITATTMDSSIYALTTATEDVAMRIERLREVQSSGQGPMLQTSSKFLPFKIPGQRARLVAVGTANGQVFVWNARATVSGSVRHKNLVTPLRVINTDSQEISSLAMTALYLVHGGSEGLVQAWDPLASTLEPIRTICSALGRRALLVAQQDTNQSIRKPGAVGAICLDPDPTTLRGIVSIGANLRYWSYSSASSSKDVSRSQKRRLQRAAKGLNSSPAESFSSARRVGLKGFVNEEMTARRIDEQEKRTEEKKQKKVAGRFGLDLLGRDASEEELIAYAKLLSEEEQERTMQKSLEKRLDKDATAEDIEAHKNALSEEDYERWKFASWEERLEMPTSEPSTITHTTPISTPAKVDRELDGDMALAMKLSLTEAANKGSFRSPPQSASSKQDDSDLAEAIQRSLHTEETTPSTSLSGSDAVQDDDVAEAIRLSLLDQFERHPAYPSPRGGRSRPQTGFSEEEDFPALQPSSTAHNSISRGGDEGRGGAEARAGTKGKGKRRAW